MPTAVEIRLRKSADIGKESIAFAKESLSGILEGVRKNGIAVQIGINVETVFFSSLGLALEMLSELAPIIRGQESDLQDRQS